MVAEYGFQEVKRKKAKGFNVSQPKQPVYEYRQKNNLNVGSSRSMSGVATTYETQVQARAIGIVSKVLGAGLVESVRGKEKQGVHVEWLSPYKSGSCGDVKGFDQVAVLHNSEGASTPGLIGLNV